MVDFTYPELNADTGTATADGLRNLANTAANAVCSAWENYAAATTGFPDPTGIGAFNNGLFSRLCTPRGQAPPPPQEEFTGGQCPIEYSVTYSIGSADPEGNPSTFPPNETATIGPVLGPIRGGGVIGNPGGGKRGVIFAAPQPAYPDGIITTWVDPTTGVEGRWNGAFSTVQSVVPTNPAQPDDCGDPEPTYDPIVPPVNVFNFPVEVNLGGVTIDADLSFNPVIFNANVLIRPEFAVNVGPFQVIFAPDGVDVYVRPQIDVTINPPGGLDPRDPGPTPQPGGGGGSGEDCPDCICLPTDLTQVNEKLDDIIECVCEPGEDKTLIVGASEGTLVSVPGYIKSVSLVIDSLDDGVRVQAGAGGSPDVFFIGWHAFGAGGSVGERLPISFLSNLYVTNSKSMNTFAFSLNFNSTGILTINYFEPEEEE